MAFQTSNGFNNQNTNSSGEKKKTNFRMGRLYASDAIVEISVWNSDSAVYTIFTAKQAIGKDPSTSANVYEQKMPNELPRVFMNPDYLRALLVTLKKADPNNVNISVSPKHGSKITITGNNGQLKIALETEKQGNRTATFEPISCGSSNVNAAWYNMIELLDVAMKKALYAKLDPDEFANALAGANSNNEEEVPI